MKLTSKVKILAGYLVSLAIVLAGSSWFYQVTEAQLRLNINEELQAIANLKAEQIAKWRTERLGDATVMMQGPYLRERVAAWMKDPQEEDTRKFLVRFRAMAEQYHYSNVRLVDVEGNARLTLNGAARPLQMVEREGMELALRENQSVMVDLHDVPGESSPKLAAVAPIFRPDGNSMKPECVIFFEIDAAEFLFPVIQFWPIPSQTGETTLLRTEGNNVIVLNDSRQLKGVAIKKSIGTNESSRVEAMAARGIRGLNEGVDFRGVPVLAVMDDVPNSPWLLVTKKDAAEAFAPLQKHIRVSGTIAGLLVLCITLTYFFMQRQLSFAETLREQKENLTVTLHSIGDAVLATDPSGRVTRMNPVAEKLTGWTLAEAMGRPVGEVFRIINEITRQPATIPVDEVLVRGEVRFLPDHTVIISRDGVERPITDSAAPIRGKDGELLGVILVFRDVTEEKRAERAISESEALQRSVIDSMMAEIAVLDHEGNVIATNQGWRRLAGVAGTDALVPAIGVGANYLEACERAAADDAFVKQTMDGIRAVLARTRNDLQHEYPRHTSAERRWFSMNVYPLDRALGGAVVIHFDITDRKQVETAMAEANAQVERANHELQTFNYSVSHDLRAPLRGIDGWSLALVEDFSDQLGERGREYLGRVRSEAQRMGKLIDDFLQMSRTTQTVIHPVAVDLSAIAQRISESLLREATGRSVEFVIHPGLNVFGDRGLLEAAMTNLVENAWKYSSKKDAARIEVGSKQIDGETVYFVSDNGAGFDMKFAQKLFAPFQRFHKATEFPGTGVGLATVQRIIHRHGGRLWADAKRNCGATFFFTLK